MRATAIWILMAIFLLLIIDSPQIGAVGSGPPAPPFSESYLAVWTQYDEYETFDRISVQLRSHLVSGNNSTEPNPNLINVTVYAEDMDLVVYQEDVRLFLGNFTVFATVLPAWTSARIQVRAMDPIALLSNETVRIRTRMSQEYFLFLDLTHEYEDDVRDRETLQSRMDLITILGTLVTVSLGISLFVIFLRVDHHRSRRVRAPSLWDRFVNRVWPYSWTNDEAYFMLEDPDTWAPDTAQQFSDFKKTAHLRKLRDQVREIQAEVRAVQEGRIHV